MKTTILRKPKFMRNEEAMIAYLKTAVAIVESCLGPELTPDQEYFFLNKMSYCLNQAAKAGGFFRTKDFIKWLTTQTNT